MEKRLVNSEFNEVKRFAAFVSELNYFKEELKNRWTMVKDGPKRIDKCVNDSLCLFEDLLDTVPTKQLKTLKNAIDDYRVSFVPNAHPMNQNVVFDKEYAKQLIDIAHDQCTFCVKTPEEAEKCPVFQLSVGIVPPDTYESLICPYSQAEWGD